MVAGGGGGIADLAQVHVKLVGREQVSDGEQLHGNVEPRRLRVTKALVTDAKRGGYFLSSSRLSREYIIAAVGGVLDAQESEVVAEASFCALCRTM